MLYNFLKDQKIHITHMTVPYLYNIVSKQIFVLYDFGHRPRTTLHSKQLFKTIILEVIDIFHEVQENLL